jgi:hypothetical protein
MNSPSIRLPDNSTPWVRTDALRLMASAAWMAVVLGVVVETAVLLTRAAGGSSPQFAQTIAEFLSSVTWSTVVCSGIALGSAAAAHRDRIMGLIGLVCAPLAWALAKGVQKGTQSMLEAHADVLGLTVLQVGILKTLEYSVLGFAVGKLTRTAQATLAQHLILGLAVGLVFGAAIVGVNVWHAPGRILPAAKLFGLSVNEVLFPIGCSVILHFVGRLNGSRSPAASQSPLPSMTGRSIGENQD